MLSTDTAPLVMEPGQETAPTTTRPSASTGSPASSHGSTPSSPAKSADLAQPPADLEDQLASALWDLREAADTLLAAMQDDQIGITDDNVAEFFGLLVTARNAKRRCDDAMLHPPLPPEPVPELPIYGVRVGRAGLSFL